jgi:DNA uptake protein ComE-like DNA-binding protein
MSSRTGERAQALVPVLFVVAILTAFAVALTVTAHREVKAAGNYLQAAQEFEIARGAIEYAAAELQAATNNGAIPPSLTAPPDTDANGWTQLGDGWYKVEIVDTASRLNINTATLRDIAALPGIQSNPDIAAAIVDWRDADENPTSQALGNVAVTGAETEYYSTLPMPYSAKNAPFDTVDELLLVRGVTTALLYGASLSGASGSGAPVGLSGSSRGTLGRQGTVAPGPAVDTSTSQIPLCELITTYSRERNVSSDGQQRVNVKTASAEDLVNRVGLTPQQAQQLINQRGQNGANINSVADLLNIFTRQVMQQIGDRVTVTDSQYRNGVININTAPAEVLATIPGVDETIYNAVISARNAGTVFTGMNDLFQLTDLNRQQLQALVDHVCTKSSVYLVRVRVRMPGMSRQYVAQALVELGAPDTQAQSETDGTAQTATTEPQPTILQFREVQRTPGWSSWVALPNPYASGGSLGIQ